MYSKKILILVNISIDTCQQCFASVTITGNSSENHLPLPRGIYSIEEGVSKYFAEQPIPDRKCEK